jgi:hypothetical protein
MDGNFATENSGPTSVGADPAGVPVGRDAGAAVHQAMRGAAVARKRGFSLFSEFRQKALNVNRDSYPGTIDKALTNNSVNLTTPERLDRPVEP